MKPVRKAVFPVAGLGTRFLPATKSVPKEMLPLVDRPLIQYAVDEARAAGIEEFIFVTSASKSALENYFGAAPSLERKLVNGGKDALAKAIRSSCLPEGTYSFVRQNEAKGLGHAVSLTQRLVGNEPFAVILPDDVIRTGQPALAQMVTAFEKNRGHMVATETVPTHKLSSYGVVDIEREDCRVQSLRGLVEKPSPDRAPSSSGIVGRYILEPTIFDWLNTLGPGSGGELQLTDAIAADLGRTGVNGFAFEGERFDCGSVQGFIQATVAFALDRPDLNTDLSDFVSDRAMGLRNAA